MELRRLSLHLWVVTALLFAGMGEAATVTWISNYRATAFAKASAEGKMVYLLGGRTGCGTCTDVKVRAVNATTPPLNQMMEECFVGWYSSLDFSREHEPYEAGLAGYSLPLMCWIDPKAPLGEYLDRRTGPLDDPIMLMLMRKALRKASPNAINLTNAQVLTDPNYVVRGRLFTNLIATQFFYRVNDGAWTEAVTGGPAQWKTNWSASLAGQPLMQGSASNKLHGYALYADGTRSMTNTWTFAYLPPPPIILSQPSPSVTLIGSVASFSIAASNATTSVWYRQGNANPLGDGATLLLSNLTGVDAGRYYCAISNGSGGIVSDPASLVIFEARLFPERCPGLRVFGPIGQSLTLLKKSDCQSESWVTVTNRILSSSLEDLLDYTASEDCATFYRLGLP